MFESKEVQQIVVEWLIEKIFRNVKEIHSTQLRHKSDVEQSVIKLKKLHREKGRSGVKTWKFNVKLAQLLRI